MFKTPSRRNQGEEVHNTVHVYTHATSSLGLVSWCTVSVCEHQDLTKGSETSDKQSMCFPVGSFQQKPSSVGYIRRPRWTNEWRAQICRVEKCMQLLKSFWTDKECFKSICRLKTLDHSLKSFHQITTLKTSAFKKQIHFRNQTNEPQQ